MRDLWVLQLAVIIRLNTVRRGDPGQGRVSSRSRRGAVVLTEELWLTPKEAGSILRSAGEMRDVRRQLARALHQRICAGSHQVRTVLQEMKSFSRCGFTHGRYSRSHSLGFGEVFHSVPNRTVGPKRELR